MKHTKFAESHAHSHADSLVESLARFVAVALALFFIISLTSCGAAEVEGSSSAEEEQLRYLTQEEAEQLPVASLDDYKKIIKGLNAGEYPSELVEYFVDSAPFRDGAYHTECNTYRAPVVMKQQVSPDCWVATFWYVNEAGYIECRFTSEEMLEIPTRYGHLHVPDGWELLDICPEGAYGFNSSMVAYFEYGQLKEVLIQGEKVELRAANRFAAAFLVDGNSVVLDLTTGRTTAEPTTEP